MLWEILSAPLSGLLWIAETIEEQAVTQHDRQENLHKKLTALQIQFDLGDISEEEFNIREQELLTAIAEHDPKA
jgi:uncharacterized membrane protein